MILLAKLFPQLQLGEKLDELKTKAFNLQMAGDEDLLDTMMWMTSGQLGFIRLEPQGLPSQPTLLVLVCALPASNADSERCFSMVHKIDSEDRSHLERNTVASLLTFKINVDVPPLSPQRNC